jgi:hypothetical protein
MGHLGFNLVRQKEPSKGVEAGGPPDQQNEKNESAELNELVIAVGDERRRCRKNVSAVASWSGPRTRTVMATVLPDAVP